MNLSLCDTPVMFLVGSGVMFVLVMSLWEHAGSLNGSHVAFIDLCVDVMSE